MEPKRKEPEMSGAVQRPGPAPDLERVVRRSSASQPLGRTRAYTDKPDFSDPVDSGSGRRSKFRMQLVAAVAAVAVVTMAGLYIGGSGVPRWLRPGQSVEQTQTQAHTLIFTSQDMDREATEKARAALQRGEIPPELADLPESARNEIVKGERALFTLRLLDEFNSLVYFRLDGAPVLNWHVSDGRKLLSVALKKGEPALLNLTAARDDGHGVHLVAATSSGELRTRTMAVGESEDWTLLVK
jgi:hypothetical protein